MKRKMLMVQLFILLSIAFLSLAQQSPNNEHDNDQALDIANDELSEKSEPSVLIRIKVALYIAKLLAKEIDELSAIYARYHEEVQELQKNSVSKLDDEAIANKQKMMQEVEELHLQQTEKLKKLVDYIGELRLKLSQFKAD